jgi:hypothetical protein
MQILEGPARAVNDTLHRIMADERHFDIAIFEMAITESRMFEHWSMHYSSLDDGEPAMVEDCVDNFHTGSIVGGRAAIHVLNRAAEREAGLIAQ